MAELKTLSAVSQAQREATPAALNLKTSEGNFSDDMLRARPTPFHNESESIDYSQKKFTFRDPNQLIKIFFDPSKNALDRAGLIYGIGDHPTPNNIEVLDRAMRDSSKDLGFRQDSFRALIQSEISSTRNATETGKILNAYIRDSSLPAAFRVIATSSLSSMGTKDSCQCCKNLALDTTLPPEIRIVASASLAYEGRGILKEIAFDKLLPESARVQAFHSLSAMHDLSELPTFLAMANGKNGESNAIRLAAIYCGMQLNPDKFLPVAKELAKSESVEICSKALLLLRKHFPMEMIGSVAEILKGTASEPFSKIVAFRALEKRSDFESKNKESALEFLSQHLGKETALRFISELPNEVRDYFIPEYTVKELAQFHEGPLVRSRLSPDEMSSYLSKLVELKDSKAAQVARQAIMKYLDDKLSPDSKFDFGMAAVALRDSKEPNDQILLLKIFKKEELPITARLEAAVSIKSDMTKEIEVLMLKASDPEIVVQAARALYASNPDKGTNALKELLNDCSSARYAADCCAKLGEGPVMELLVQRVLNVKPGNLSDNNALIAIGEALKKEGSQTNFVAAVSRMATRETNNKQATLLRSWSENLLKCKELGIETPLRMHPDTLNEVIRNRTLSSKDLSKDKRPVAVIILPKEDHNGFAYCLRNGLSQLISNGYRIMLYEAGSRDGIIASVKQGAPKEGAELIAYVAHGAWDGMSFGGNDPGKGSKINPANGISVNDTEFLKASGMGQSLKKNGRIFLISCSVGAEGANANNMANMFRTLAPQARPGGISAPRIPTTFESFLFDSKHKAIDFSGNAEHYQASADLNEDYFVAAA